MSIRFDLRSIQSDSFDLPSVSEFQSMERIPSLQDLQEDRPDLPSLRSFQSNEKLERVASLKILQRQGRHVRRPMLAGMRKFHSVDCQNPPAEDFELNLADDKREDAEEDDLGIGSI